MTRSKPQGELKLSLVEGQGTGDHLHDTEQIAEVGSAATWACRAARQGAVDL